MSKQCNPIPTVWLEKSNEGRPADPKMSLNWCDEPLRIAVPISVDYPPRILRVWQLLRRASAIVAEQGGGTVVLVGICTNPRPKMIACNTIAELGYAHLERLLTRLPAGLQTTAPALLIATCPDEAVRRLGNHPAVDTLLTDPGLVDGITPSHIAAYTDCDVFVNSIVSDEDIGHNNSDDNVVRQTRPRRMLLVLRRASPESWSATLTARALAREYGGEVDVIYSDGMVDDTGSLTWKHRLIPFIRRSVGGESPATVLSRIPTNTYDIVVGARGIRQLVADSRLNPSDVLAARVENDPAESPAEDETVMGSLDSVNGNPAYIIADASKDDAWISITARESCRLDQFL